MSKTQKPIHVNFCTYRPYDSFPHTCIYMGEINTAQLNDLLDAFKTECNLKHNCILSMSVRFSDNLSFDPLSIKLETVCRSRSLNLSGMFDLQYASRIRPSTFRAPCMADATPLPKTAEEMTDICANNLQCGKCRDEYIRKTLGATLFPQHYANEKQK